MHTFPVWVANYRIHNSKTNSEYINLAFYDLCQLCMSVTLSDLSYDLLGEMLLSAHILDKGNFSIKEQASLNLTVPAESMGRSVL